MSAAKQLMAPVINLAQQIGNQIEALEAQEAGAKEAVGRAHLAGASEDEIARLDAARDAIRKRREGLEAARDALHARERAEAAVQENAQRMRLAVECDAQLRAILAEGEALTPAVLEMGARLRDLLARGESLVFAADTSRETRNLLRERVAALVGFALQGVVSLPKPDGEPACPFTRFANDLRADLDRAGLALPTTTTNEEPSDHA